MLLNLTRREAALLDRALDAYIATDEHANVRALQSVRDKLAVEFVAGRWAPDDASFADAPLHEEQR